MKYLIVITTLIITGCANLPLSQTLPGSVSDTKSEIDGSKTLYMNPGWLFNTPMQLGLVMFSTNKTRILLTAKLTGIHKIEKTDSLAFNIDSEVVKLSADDEKTEHSVERTTKWSSKTYVINKQLLEKIVNAKRVFVNFGGIEADFSKGGPTTAKNGFNDFFKRLATF